MPTIIELRPDKRLMNASFEKYQFIDNPVVISSKKKLDTEVLRVEPDASQDSWLEARSFAYHNHLYYNPYNERLYFVNKIAQILNLNENGTLDVVHKLTTPMVKPNFPVYNPSLSFAGENVMVASNGQTNLEILLNHDNGTFHSCVFDDIESGVILDSVTNDDKSLINVVMYSIIEENGKKCSQLVVYSYSCSIVNENSSSQHSHDVNFVGKKILRVQGAVEHAGLEPNGLYLHVTSQDSATFILDSLKPITKELPTEKSQEINIPKYCWSQDEETLTVWLKTLESIEKNNICIDVKANNILIQCKDVTLISGQSAHRLDPDLTTWSHESGTLKIELFKTVSGLMWNELIRGDTGGECLPNEALAAEVHSRLAHLCTAQPESGQPMLGFNSEQLEECDIQEKENLFQRIRLDSHETTHQIVLGANNHILFIQKAKYGHIICLRHDHDGCVWNTTSGSDNEWKLKHISTFPGFGYVAASKTNRKFCVSPPNGSYVAIVEHVRHVFMYEKPTSNPQIGHQHIVDLGSAMQTNPILGAIASDTHLYLLTKNQLYQLQIKATVRA